MVVFSHLKDSKNCHTDHDGHSLVRVSEIPTCTLLSLLSSRRHLWRSLVEFLAWCHDNSLDFSITRTGEGHKNLSSHVCGREPGAAALVRCCYLLIEHFLTGREAKVVSDSRPFFSPVVESLNVRQTTNRRQQTGSD